MLQTCNRTHGDSAQDGEPIGRENVEGFRYPTVLRRDAVACDTVFSFKGVSFPGSFVTGGGGASGM